MSNDDRWRVMQTLLLLPLISISLKFSTYHQIYQILSDSSEPRDKSRKTDLALESNQNMRARHISELVIKTSWKSIYPTNCLPRSLTLWWILRKQGFQPDFIMGVKKESRELEGHAWVEYQGLVLNDSQDVKHQYSVIEIPNNNSK